jgi:ATP-dependent Clp protease ATP-binding subunit ClpA
MPTFSNSLEQSLHRALTFANDRRHEYATLEHLLLALIEDDDATAVMRACNVDLKHLKGIVSSYVDKDLNNLVSDYGEDSKPTTGFQPVPTCLWQFLPSAKAMPLTFCKNKK